jgi:hypothetical protein
VWCGKVITLTSCFLNIVRTSGLVRKEQLSINKIAGFLTNWSFVYTRLMNGIRTFVTYCWNSAAVRYGFCLHSNNKSTLIRNSSVFSFSIIESLTCEEIITSVIDFPLADTQHTIDICLRLWCTTWWIGCPDIEIRTITFHATRFSNSDIPTSFKLNTKSAQHSCTCCLSYSIIVSRNDRGISSRGFSWGRLVVSKSWVGWWIKKESTHPSVMAVPRVSRG